MTVPDYQTIMLPLLRFASDQREHSLREAIEELAGRFELNEQERKEMLPSGRQATFDNRVGWASTYMRKAGLLGSKRRGRFRITSRGLEALQKNPRAIDARFLEQYPEFVEFRAKRPAKVKPTPPGPTKDNTQTPEEDIEAAYQAVRRNLASDLVQQVMECSPSFFERMVVDLLVKMGYGGTRKDAGQAIGQSGDEGIDGIINEDRLGLDVIYIQAKRWEGPVGRPEIQKFVGALQGRRARKGIFITTSIFTRQAADYASMIGSSVVLVDGDTLAELMIDNNVGVSPVAAYELKRVDSDYFDEA